MNDLIEALQIFSKYTSDEYPTACDHDVLYVMVNPDDVSEEDINRLAKLDFFPGDNETFESFRFGSC